MRLIFFTLIAFLALPNSEVIGQDITVAFNPLVALGLVALKGAALGYLIGKTKSKKSYGGRRYKKRYRSYGHGSSHGHHYSSRR